MVAAPRRRGDAEDPPRASATTFGGAAPAGTVVAAAAATSRSSPQTPIVTATPATAAMADHIVNRVLFKLGSSAAARRVEFGLGQSGGQQIGGGGMGFKWCH